GQRPDSPDQHQEHDRAMLHHQGNGDARIVKMVERALDVVLDAQADPAAQAVEGDKQPQQHHDRGEIGGFGDLPLLARFAAPPGRRGFGPVFTGHVTTSNVERNRRAPSWERPHFAAASACSAAPVPAPISPTMTAITGRSSATVARPIRILAGVPTMKTLTCGTSRATSPKATSTSSSTPAAGSASRKPSTNIILITGTAARPVAPVATAALGGSALKLSASAPSSARCPLAST